MKIKNMNRGMLSRLVAVAAIALCCVMALPTVVHAEDVPEAKIEFHIKTEADFLSCVALSRERDTSGWHVYLDNDIELDSDDMKTIVADTVKHLSFGNKEHPFKGVFDGQNHAVEGLNYDKDAFDPERDTGFFAETNGATIKNFLVKDANVWADFPRWHYRGQGRQNAFRKRYGHGEHAARDLRQQCSQPHYQRRL